MTEHIYSSDFYDYIDDGSRKSARIVVPLLLAEIGIGSVLDVGSGHGAWAAEWVASGVEDVVAVDGDYVARDRLQIAPERFVPHDLMLSLDLGRRFDLVQSLEVAEHLPEALADQFVDGLLRHGDVIFFSAAVPHQGGEHHVNEQPPSYWQRKFAARGFRAFDFLRPALADNPAVKPWYRFNSTVYANDAGEERLSGLMRETKLPDGADLPQCGDIAWALRRISVRLLPQPLIKPLAMVKASLEARLRR